MKNKALKNLIALGIFVFLFVGVNSVSAYYVDDMTGYNPSYIVPNYYTSSYSNSYYSNSPANNNYVQSASTYQPYTYVEPAQQQIQYVQQPAQVQYVQQPAQVQYVQQPTQIKYIQPQVQYVQQPAQVQYVPQQTQTIVRTNTLGASVYNSNQNPNTVATVNRIATTGPNGNSGAFVNYDGNNQSVLVASAYGSQPLQQVVTTSDNNNGLTALTVKGSGSFMPSSVFQWFIVMLLILAIVIIARMIGKSVSNGSHAAPAH